MELDLNAVTLTKNVHDSWLKNLQKGVATLQKQYPDLTPDEIPDEKFGIFEDGAYIFVDVRETRLRMKVPEDSYRILN